MYNAPVGLVNNCCGCYWNHCWAINMHGASMVHRWILYQSPKFLVASICNLPDVINCQFCQFSAALLGPELFLSPDQQSGIHCLIICVIPPVDSEQFRCSSDIRSVSAFETLRNRALQINIYLLALSVAAELYFMLFLWMVVSVGCCNWLCCSSTLSSSCASTTQMRSCSSCSTTQCLSWSRMSTLARASTGSSLTLALISSQRLTSLRRSVQCLRMHFCTVCI